MHGLVFDEHGVCRTFTFIYIFQEHRSATGGAAGHSSSDNDTWIPMGPLKVEIVQGDLTKEHTSAIVNSTDKYFNHSGIM